VRGPMARTASLLRADADHLTREASAAAEDLVEEEPDGVSLPVAALLSVSAAIASRVVRLALYRLGALPEAEHVRAVLDLAAGRPGRRRDLPGLLAVRDGGYVRLARSSPGT
jgi:hypothetical protein